MTRAEFENALWRAGLTTEQVREVSAAADAYATAQALAAIDAIGKVAAA